MAGMRSLTSLDLLWIHSCFGWNLRRCAKLALPKGCLFVAWLRLRNLISAAFVFALANGTKPLPIRSLVGEERSVPALTFCAETLSFNPACPFQQSIPNIAAVYPIAGFLKIRGRCGCALSSWSFDSSRV
mmetsp:Transcript_4890/g.9273  ORF Transcript_4890/g.9273 Transcript_4890/m.9273 type:complete len:130 (+) Transcript_4890:411-800(+)